MSGFFTTLGEFIITIAVSILILVLLGLFCYYVLLPIIENVLAPVISLLTEYGYIPYIIIISIPGAKFAYEREENLIAALGGAILSILIIHIALTYIKHKLSPRRRRFNY